MPRHFGVILVADLPAHRGATQQQAALTERLPLSGNDGFERNHGPRIPQRREKSTLDGSGQSRPIRHARPARLGQACPPSGECTIRDLVDPAPDRAGDHAVLETRPTATQPSEVAMLQARRPWPP